MMLMFPLMLVTVDHGSDGNRSNRKAEDQHIESLLIRLSQTEAEDKTVLGEIYEAVRTPVYAYALSLLKNPYDAEDALHDALLLIHHAVARYRPDGKPMAWIMTITKNLCYQKLRERKKLVDFSEEALDRYADESDRVTAEDRIVLQQCLRMLSDEEHEILVMHAVAGMKHRHIAEILDIPLSTVLSKYHRALKKLRKEMH